MSVIATAVKHMLGAGLPHETIIAAIAEMEAELPKQRTSGALRQERYRRNKASQSVTCDESDACDAKGVSDKGPPDPLKLPSPKTTPSPPSGAPSPSPAKRRSRFCPDHWNPSEPTLDLARQLGFTDDERAMELTKMRDHEFRDPHTDWDKTFRQWLRRAAERLPNRARDGPKVLAVVDEDFIARQQARIEEYARQKASGNGSDHAP